MTISVKIFDEREEKIPLPVEIVLGRNLQCGKLNGERLVNTKTPKMRYMSDADESESYDKVFAFLPNCAVRGFMMTYLSGNGSGIELEIELPAAPDEIRELFCAAVRVSDFFGGAPVIADGNKMTAEKFMSNLDSFLGYNEHLAVDLFAGIIAGDHKPEYMQCVFFAITIGRNEAMSFGGTLNGFVEYIDDLKRLDVFIAPLVIEKKNGKTIGTYVLNEGMRTVLPTSPYVPPQMADAVPSGCDLFRIALVSSTNSGIVGVIDYDDFIALVPEKKRTYFDPDRFMITVTSFELEALSKLRPLQSDDQRRRKRWAANKTEKRMYVVSTVISAAVLAGILMISDFSRNGFSVSSLVIYPSVTAVFYALFFFIGMFFKKMSYRDVTDLRARKKIDEAEKTLGVPQNNKFTGFVNRGGKKGMYCEASLFFLADKVYMLHYYSRKIFTAEIAYDQIEKVLTSANLLCIETKDGDKFVMDMKTDYEAFRARMVAKKLGFVKDETIESYSKLFMTYYEAKDNVGGNLIEFRFNDAVMEKDEKENGKSVFASYREYFVLVDGYEKLFFPDGDSDFIHGKKYDADKTSELLLAINDSGKNDETLVPWLSEAAKRHGGFEIIGSLAEND